MYKCQCTSEQSAGGEGGGGGNNTPSCHVNPLTPGISHGDIKVILTFESVDGIAQCHHSNDSSSAVLPHGTIYI